MSTSFKIVADPELTVISTMSEDPFVKYRKGIPIPEVMSKL